MLKINVPFRLTVTIYFIFLFGDSLLSSVPIIVQYQDLANQIIKEAQSDSTAYNRLGYLCDSFGPRLSGSKNLEKSINWIIKPIQYFLSSDHHLKTIFKIIIYFYTFFIF